ncbi:hypothetical protein MAR_029950 [Mya arenaria]|uniref:Uncharacterized protein n=1 Tax=Mya arenaria TaxID=6604 RepID=A0ABY7DKQ4_MYAAR|nr:hypothetical protein MAR_029950 [Mya arenaria]
MQKMLKVLYEEYMEDVLRGGEFVLNMPDPLRSDVDCRLRGHEGHHIAPGQGQEIAESTGLDQETKGGSLGQGRAQSPKNPDLVVGRNHMKRELPQDSHLLLKSPLLPAKRKTDMMKNRNLRKEMV